MGDDRTLLAPLATRSGWKGGSRPTPSGDGLVGGDDALVFGELYVQGDPEADFEPDGAIDALDEVGYQEAGIP